MVSALGTAYVEGQLTATEHQDRVARALSAETLGELSSLVDDLTPDTDSPLAQERARPRHLHRRLALAAVGAVSVVAVVFAVNGADEDATTTVSPHVEHVAPVVPYEPVEDEPEEEPEALPQHDPLTVAALQEFVDAYDEEFGTTRIYDASFRDDGGISFEALHGPAHKNRLQGWRWDPVDGFSSSDEPSANVFSYAPVNLEKVDLEAVVRNLAHAQKYLNVESPDSTRFTLSRRDIDDSPARVIIYVSNGFNESAMMRTTLGGELISSHPFSPDGR